MKCARVIALSLAVIGCRPQPPAADVGFVARWTATHYALARAERLSPPVASRVSAYAAIALYEGWAAFSDSLRSLAGQLNGLDALPKPRREERYDPATVAMEAQTAVLLELYKQGFASTPVAVNALHDSLLAVRRAAGVSDPVVNRSLTFGAELGRAILAWAATDRFLETRGKEFTMPVGPQYWVPTATEAQYRSQSLSAQTDLITVDDPTASKKPSEMSERSLTLGRPKRPGTLVPGINVTKPVEPYWGDLRPFALETADSCQAPVPVPFSTSPSSAFYAQARTVYDVGNALTPEQRKIAYFWADNPGESGTPAGHWLGIISQLATARHLTPERAAEVYAVAAIGMADAFIACWRLKFRVNLIRPVTYIQRYIDKKWQTVLLTPPFPEYASGHAIQSAATAEILTALLGDNTPFDDATHVGIGHPPRHFGSFREAARQVAMSRLYGGIHYPMGNENGAEQGRCIGRHVLARVRTRRVK